MKSTAQSKPNSIRTLVIFCGIVAILISSSLIFKIIQSVRTSIYNPKNAFVLSIQTSDGIVVYNVVPKEKQLPSYRLTSPSYPVNPGRDLGIATDARVTVSTHTTARTRLKEILPSLVFHSEKLSWFDILRLYIVTSRMDENVDEDTAVFKKDSADDHFFGTIFNDPEIIQEKHSIGIVNATGQGGVGARLERILESRGVTVVSVTTSPQDKNTSEIQYSEEDSYTLQKIRKLLGFQSTQMTEETPSDILIILGKDSLKTSLY